MQLELRDLSRLTRFASPRVELGTKDDLPCAEVSVTVSACICMYLLNLFNTFRVSLQVFVRESISQKLAFGRQLHSESAAKP